MGIPEDHEAPPSPTTQDMANKERLPLYSEPHHTSPGEPQQPQDRATPDEVRDFLVQLLIANRGLPTDHARRIAAKMDQGYRSRIGLLFTHHVLRRLWLRGRLDRI